MDRPGSECGSTLLEVWAMAGQLKGIVALVYNPPKNSDFEFSVCFVYPCLVTATAHLHNILLKLSLKTLKCWSAMQMPTISTDCLFPCMLHLALFRFVTTIPFVQQATKNRATNELKFPAPRAGEPSGNVNLRINAWNDEVCFYAAVYTLQSHDENCTSWRFHLLYGTHSVVIFPFISRAEQVC